MTIQDILNYAARNQGTININVLRGMLETLISDQTAEDEETDDQQDMS